MRAAFVSLRGVVFFVVAIVVGGGLGVGGYWVYDTYFPSADRLVEKADDKFQQAEVKFRDSQQEKTESLRDSQQAEAEKLYKEANVYLNRLAQKLTDEGKDLKDPKAYLLKAKVCSKLSRFAEERDRQKGQGNDPNSDHAKLAIDSNEALRQTLTHDSSNAEAAGILLDKCFFDDDMDKAEFYAEAVSKYKPEEGKEMIAGMPNRVAAAHYILGKAALRSPNPRPDVALDHLRQIEELSQDNTEARWREVALEAQALKTRIELTKKLGAAPAKPAAGKGAKDETGEELRRKVLAGIERAKQDLSEAANKPDSSKSTLVTMNPTNVRGLLDFLILAIETSATKEEVQERANLFLAVCEQLTAVKEPRKTTIQAVSAHLAQLPAVVDKPAAERKVPALRLLAADWAPIEARMRKVVELTTAAGTALDANAYLELARKAHKDNRWKDAEEMAKKGLEQVRNKKDDPGAAALHAEAGWALFMQGKTQEAGEHLVSMRKDRRSTANLIDGLTAVREGRLETGIRNLLAAQQDPRYARSPLVYMGLARAYEGVGQTERALTMLRKLETVYKNADQLSDEERTLAIDFLPDADSVNFEILRSLLKLNQLDEALKYKEKLDKRAAGLAARILLINYYVNLGREALTQANLLDARDDFTAARNELKVARVTYPNEPALVRADAVLTGSQPDMTRPFGLQASKGGAPKTGPTAVEQAEKKLQDYVAQKKDFDSNLLWVRWLESQGRYDDADAALTQMGKDFADRAKQIEALQARLGLVRGRSTDAAKLVEVLRGKPNDLGGDVLQLLYLTSQSEPASKSQTLNTVLGKHESNVLSHLWRGQLAQQAGDFREAALSYGRALPPSRYQAEAQVGLLTTLLTLAKDSPKEAAKLIDELRRDNSIDPVVLLAYAEMSRRLDNIQGREAMEGGLRALERVLTSAKATNGAIAADLLARGYYAAGRADLARTEAARALQIDPSYAPALALSARLAADAEDWDACLANAESLERTLYGTPDARRESDRAPAPHSVLDRTQPTLTEANAWRAVALEQLGRSEEAKRVYQELVKSHAKLSTGYLGLAAMREHAKDVTGALEYVKQWRDMNPTDAAGLTAEVRLLVKAGKVNDATKTAEQFVAETMKTKNADEVAALMTVARAFAAAKAYDQAEEWGRKAVAAAGNKDKDAVVAAHMIVGNACMARAMAKPAGERKDDVDKALAEYNAVWKLVPGHRGAGIRMALLKAKERNEGDAAYAAAQEARKGRFSQKLLGGDRLSLDQLDALGEVYRATKHPGEAVTLFREAVKRHPQEPQVALQLGLAYRDQRMLRDAVLTLNQAQLAAQQKADGAKDAEQKARWQAVADEARTEREKLEFKPAGKQ